MRSKLKKWSKPFLESHKEIALDETAVFDYLRNTSDVFLEIGTGKGDFITGMASKYPNRNFLGVEFVVSVAAVAAKKVYESKATNVVLFNNDVNKLFPLIEDKSINGIYLNFSDPWPKARHEKRRLTSPNFLKQYMRILKDDAYIIMKTDNHDLFTYSLETLKELNFNIIVSDFDYQIDSTDVMTEYEQKFRGLGQKIHLLKAKRG